jgi:hypothetical protein
MRIVLALLLTLATHAGAAELWGRVVSLPDGDTLTVLDGDRVLHTVRLAGIDSPERRQAFGNVSRQHLAGLVFDRDVTVEWLPARAPGPRVCPDLQVHALATRAGARISRAGEAVGARHRLTGGGRAALDPGAGQAGPHVIAKPPA